MVVSGRGLNSENISVDFADELEEDFEVLLLSQDRKRGCGDESDCGLVGVTKFNSPVTTPVPLTMISVLTGCSREFRKKLSAKGGCKGLTCARNGMDDAASSNTSLPGYSRTAVLVKLAEPKKIVGKLF